MRARGQSEVRGDTGRVAGEDEGVEGSHFTKICQEEYEVVVFWK